MYNTVLICSSDLRHGESLRYIKDVYFVYEKLLVESDADVTIDYYVNLDGSNLTGTIQLVEDGMAFGSISTIQEQKREDIAADETVADRLCVLCGKTYYGKHSECPHLTEEEQKREDILKSIDPKVRGMIDGL